ncbi:zincin [Piromyces finnis]|uniref:Zincin n=1 Tax=Piromyces finnis TaxID=1754191 RepID=A0A1Y1VID5_9FUNG|nr:zincin [Piromyces finnis]|eukprot:ORX57153.1 zincin [Piromyces finnis]
MNFKKISFILPLFCLNLKVFAGPVVGEVDLSSDNESDNEVFSVGEDIDLSGDGVKIVDIFSDDESTVTDIIDSTIEECSSEECIQTSKRILNKMDISINPCDDFYHFACGGWESKAISNEIDNKNEFEKLSEKVDNEIIEILKGEYKVDEKLSQEDQEYDEKNYKKVKDIFNFCMKSESNESYPNEHLKNFVKNLNITENLETLKERESLTKMMTKLQLNGVEPFIYFFPDRQPSISKNVIMTLYVSEEMTIHSYMHYLIKKAPKIIPLYKEFIKNIYTSIIGNRPDIDLVVDKIYETENKISEIFINNNFEDYEYLTLKQLNEKYTFINWDLYLNNIFEYYNLSTIINSDMLIYNPLPKLYEEINNVISELSADNLAYYFEWNAIYMDILDDYYSSDILEESDKFIELLSTINGEENELHVDGTYISQFNYNKSNSLVNTIKKKYSKTKSKPNNSYTEDENSDKDNICLNYIYKTLPLTVSKYYVSNYFDDNNKVIVKQMINNIKEAMIIRINKMEWLDEETKEYAMKKVSKMKESIGYFDDIMNPKKIYQEYENLNIDNKLDLIIKSKVLNYGSILKLFDDTISVYPYVNI